MPSILDAAHLEEQERQYEITGEMPEQEIVTFADVVDHMRRIAYHKRMMAQEDAEAEALIAPLQAEIDKIKAWQEERRKKRLRSIEFNEKPCILYYRTNPPSKGKTIKGPGWRISAKDLAPKWSWQDDVAVASTLAELAPELVKTEPIVDKNKVKAATEYGLVRVMDGKVYVVNAETGQLVEVPGVTVETPETVYKVEVEES